MTETTAKNATMEDLVSMLRTQHDIKYDVVVPAERLSYANGNLRVQDGATDISDWGVKLVPQYLRPTREFDTQIATKLGIPVKYMRKLREELQAPWGGEQIIDLNVNHWLNKREGNVFVRGFEASEWGDTGIARAFLSDQFGVIDHLDGLFAALDGISKAGIDIEIGRCDLTNRSMYVQVKAPQVAVRAPELLGDYRSPFTGQSGSEIPIVFAGFEIRNSETGWGAFSLVPRLEFKVCNNGMTIKKDAMRKVHLGSKMDEGVVKWSEQTRYHYIELIKNQTSDAVTQFLSQDYLEEKVRMLESTGEHRIDDAQLTLTRVGKKLNYTEEEQNGIMNMFISGGQMRAIGVANAVTAYAQVVDSPDRAAELTDSALEAMFVSVR